MLPTQSALAFTVSDPLSIKAYFERLREMVKTGELYPVKFDEVWPLIYDRKDAAVRALKADFTQDYDYQSVHINVERAKGGSRKLVYSISVGCMEWLIARKIRPVFEVYRKIFHQAVNMIAHVPQASVIAKLEKLEHTLALMKKESARQFKVRKEQFWHNVRVRQEQRTKTKQEQERQELFDLFERYRKAEHYSQASTILDSIVFWTKAHYNYDLEIQPRKTCQHYFDVAIGQGKGYIIAEIIKCHLSCSNKL